MSVPRIIVIIGAGIGGLTAALAMAARGLRVVILEKADRLEEAGAGLQLSPNASRILIGLGLRDALAANAVTPANIRIMSTTSGEVSRLPVGDAASEGAGAPYWVIHRADLQAALLSAVAAHPAIELRLGCNFESFTDDDGVRVHYSSGGDVAEQTCDALIGADGVWSSVRQQLFPTMTPTFSGSVAWRGTVDAGAVSADRRCDVQLWMGSQAHVVAYPISSGQRINVVAIIDGEWKQQGWSAPGNPSEITARFSARWPGELAGLINAVTEWRCWALFTMPVGGAWNSSAVALLGDASHAMLPFAAQGAGMAIEDAAVLADCLSGSGDVPAALERYRSLRQPRVRKVQRTARQSGQIYHLGGPMALARDLSMKLLGPRRLQTRQDWIHNWKP